MDGSEANSEASFDCDRARFEVDTHSLIWRCVAVILQGILSESSADFREFFFIGIFKNHKYAYSNLFLPLIIRWDFVHSLTLLPPIQKSTTSARTTWPRGASTTQSQAALELYFAGQFIDLENYRNSGLEQISKSNVMWWTWSGRSSTNFLSPQRLGM